MDSLYDLMDAACDVDEIADHSRQFGHVPIIEHKARRGEKDARLPLKHGRNGL